MKIRFAWLCAAFLPIALLASCKSGPIPTSTANPTSTRIVPTASSTTAPAIEIAFTDTPAPTPTNAPRTLTICTGDEPDTLYTYGGTMYIASSIQEAIYDGPIDSRGYEYQPVILEKIPSLADGDAVILPVVVQPGSFFIDATGTLSTLHEGISYRPAGCRSSECEQVYSGTEPVILDQMVVTFTLKTGILWSDGSPLTSRDSVYSYELDSHPNTPTSKYLVNRTDSYKTSGPVTTVWIGKPGFLSQTYFLNFWQPLPEHLWRDYSPSELLEADISVSEPVGWGPYIIDEWKVGSHIRLHKNPFYFRAAEGLPHFDTLVFRFVGQNSTRNVASLLDGSCDVVNLTAQLDDVLRDLVELDAARELELITSPGTVFEHLDFGILPAAYDDGYQPTQDRPDFFGDVRTRQAFAFCINRQVLVDEIFYGKSEVMHSYVSDSHPLFDPTVGGYAHNIQVGGSLLTEVGWIDDDGQTSTPRIAHGIPHVPDGTPFSVTLLITTATQRLQAARLIADSLAECGVDVQITALEPADLFADGPSGPIFGRGFELAMFASLTGFTPPCNLWLSAEIPAENGASGWAGDNDTGFNNLNFDVACTGALAFLPGEAGYSDAHRAAQGIFLQNVPTVPLYLRMFVAATRAGFSGLHFEQGETTEMWNIEEFNYPEQ